MSQNLRKKSKYCKQSSESQKGTVKKHKQVEEAVYLQNRMVNDWVRSVIETVAQKERQDPKPSRANHPTGQFCDPGLKAPGCCPGRVRPLRASWCCPGGARPPKAPWCCPGRTRPPKAPWCCPGPGRNRPPERGCSTRSTPVAPEAPVTPDLPVAPAGPGPLGPPCGPAPRSLWAPRVRVGPAAPEGQAGLRPQAPFRPCSPWALLAPAAPGLHWPQDGPCSHEAPRRPGFRRCPAGPVPQLPQGGPCGPSRVGPVAPEESGRCWPVAL